MHPERDLLRLLPRVLRARDFHLYLEGGKRLTDLWLQGGRAILGHKPPRVLGELKNAAERGLFSALPHPMERRFIKALEVFFPGMSFRIYSGEASLYQALAQSGFPEPPYFDPAFQKQGAISLWRPFLNPNQAFPVVMGDNDIVVPVLPWPLDPVIMVLGKNVEETFPPGELVPPVLLAPATRALYDLKAALDAKPRNRNSVRFYKVEKAIKDSPWRRRGIYLAMEQNVDRVKYGELFKRFLEGGFLLPPSPLEPIILPAAMSNGEESKLAELLKVIV